MKMKTKFILLNLIVIAAITTSCGGSHIESTEKDWHNYLTTLSDYYPYSIDDEFIFKNDSLGVIWKNQPFTYSGDSIYPQTDFWSCNDPFASCYGDRTINISADFIEEGVSRYAYAPSNVSTFIAQSGSPEVWISWDIMLSFGPDNYYRGTCSVLCLPAEVLGQLTDTIIIPIRRQGTTNGEIDIPDGAYARIIKNKGLTDFSTDGKTVWKRVQF